jgi:hypothetical protein
MNSKAVLFTSFSLFLCAKAVAAADPLSEVQMDSVTAGQILGIECSSCTLSSSASMSVNGVTTSTSSTSGTGTGGTGTGGTGGGGGGNGGGGNGGGGPIVPSVGTAVQVPANVAAIISAAGVSRLSSP